eukprot:SAG31_NODE_7975_length_1550_cov_4.577533_2_plen_198_part_00
MNDQGMFVRKLRALGYPEPVPDVADDAKLQRLVIWLEDRKIRHYSIRDREPLRQSGTVWEQAFVKYLKDLECCHILTDIRDIKQRTATIDWLLGEAVGLEYADNAPWYTSVGSRIASLSLRQFTYDDPEIVQTIQQLAETLQIPRHGSLTETLQAIQHICAEKLTPKAIASLNAEAGTLAHDTSLAKFPTDFKTGGI